MAQLPVLNPKRQNEKSPFYEVGDFIDYKSVFIKDGKSQKAVKTKINVRWLNQMKTPHA